MSLDDAANWIGGIPNTYTGGWSSVNVWGVSRTLLKPNVPCKSYVIKLIQSAYLTKLGRSNQRKYQYDDGAVNVRPKRFPLASNVCRRVCSNATKFWISASLPPRSGAPGYSQSMSRPSKPIGRDQQRCDRTLRWILVKTPDGLGLISGLLVLDKSSL